MLLMNAPDSSINIVYPGSGPAVCTVRIASRHSVWTSGDSIVAADHDCQPYVLMKADGESRRRVRRRIRSHPFPIQPGWTQGVEQRGL